MIDQLAFLAAGSDSKVLLETISATMDLSFADRKALMRQMELWVCRLTAKGETVRAEALVRLLELAESDDLSPHH